MRRWVATKNKLSPELKPALAADEDSGVRRAIAGHKKVPVELLEEALSFGKEPKPLGRRGIRKIAKVACRESYANCLI